ncbi:MAG: hypothetical protein VST71_06315, partial [Nitrospirota bacterium]|nr:hypothetical protein [Nitrospirota bacterium]
TGRNIVVAIIFHITAGYFNEIFATHPDSKVIQTIILIIIATVIVIKEKNFFFTKELDLTAIPSEQTMQRAVKEKMRMS